MPSAICFLAVLFSPYFFDIFLFGFFFGLVFCALLFRFWFFIYFLGVCSVLGVLFFVLPSVFLVGLAQFESNFFSI